jgi:hypothetical protein
MESCVVSQLTVYLENNGLLPDSQYGFRARRSTTGLLLQCAHSWAGLISSGTPADVVFLDYAKAFDKVGHRKLGLAMSSLGIRGPLFNWLCDFLSGRSQRVAIGSSLSSPSPLLSSVPQGAALSPLLWTMFGCSLARLLSAFKDVQVHYFADDCQLASSNPASLQSALDVVSQWSSDWQLVLSPSKCVVLPLGPGLQCSYTVAGAPIPLSTERFQRDLGILMSSNLSFSPHITHIVCKTSSVCALIRRCFTQPSPTILTRAFTSYVLPIIEYASPVFNSLLSAADVDRLERIQRRFTSYVFRKCNLPNRSLGYDYRRAVLGLDTLARRRQIIDLTFLFKVYHGLQVCPSILVRKVTPRTLRNNSRLLPDSMSSGVAKKLWPNSVISTWNSLPESVILGKLAAFSEYLAVNL